MLAAGYGVTDVAGAGVPIVAVERRARRARAPLTRLGAVAHVPVTARGAVRQRCVRADARVAAVRRARVVVDALRVRGAGKAARDGGVDAGAHRVARIGGARVSVVAVEGWPHGTDPRQARLGTVAHVAVAARGAVEDRRVLAARHRVADVGRARVPVVAVEGRPRGAGPRQARLGAVAHVAVAARGAVRQRRAPASAQRVAGVGRTRIVVVAVERCPGDADARQAGLRTVAHVAIAARRAVRQRRVLTAGERVAGVRGARVAVVAVEGGARGADPRQARLRAVAHVPVAARRAVRHRRVLTAGHRVAGVRGAGTVVVAVERRPGATGARLA